VKRSEAKRLGLATYQPDRPCTKGHDSLRRTNSAHCTSCERETLRKPEWREYRKKHFLKNRDRVLRQSREYYEANKFSVLARTAAWAKKNPDKQRESRAKWYKNNTAYCFTKNASYRAQRLRAKPVWADELEILNVYRDCRNRNQRGGKYHVDHIIPLKNKTVCGLHVSWNLQIITATENVRKRNKFCPEAAS
jgi:hypothetical protein